MTEVWIIRADVAIDIALYVTDWQMVLGTIALY
jgi:hypothetical protein